MSINEIIPYLAPLVVIQISLQIYAIINLIKRKKVRFGNKLLWGFIIVFFQVLGVVIYLVFRGDDQ